MSYKFRGINIDEETLHLFQETMQKIREKVNNTLDDEEDRKEFLLATSVQFFLYSLIPSNERFLRIDEDDYADTLKKFHDMLDAAIIAKIKD